MTRRRSRLVASVAALGLIVGGACSSDDQADSVEGTVVQDGSGDEPLSESAGDSPVPVPNKYQVRTYEVIVGEAAPGGQAEIILGCWPPDSPPPFEAKALMLVGEGGINLTAEVVEATEGEDRYRMLITIPSTLNLEAIPPDVYEVRATCNPNGDSYAGFDLTLLGP